MAELLQKFTISRNILGADAEKSARRVRGYIDQIGDGKSKEEFSNFLKADTNNISSIANYTGLFEKLSNGGYGPNELTSAYMELSQVNAFDAWQWFITRTLANFVVPNGTSSHLNKVAREGSFQFNFFQKMIALMASLNGISGDARYLGFHELCELLNKDENWLKSPIELLSDLLARRNTAPVANDRHLIDDLENEFEIPRDNLNTVLVKAFKQTGLFEYKHEGGAPVAIALKANMSDVHQKRVRHIIDNPRMWLEEKEGWNDFIQSRVDDLPLEVENRKDEEVPSFEQTASTPGDLSRLVDSAHADFSNAGLKFDVTFLRRFFASCATKPFVILTGLSGSGKTKLAEAVASWLTRKAASEALKFEIGQIVKSDRKEYKIVAVDDLSVVLATDSDVEGNQAKLTTLPKALIMEWVDVIRENGFDVSKPARDIRKLVAHQTAHDPQINALESHLKATAFDWIDQQAKRPSLSGYKVVPVGPDWTSGEFVLGYPDALDDSKYVRKPALDIILQALDYPDVPHFLILDEMNLSHVERYFAEILSAIESANPIELFSSDKNMRRGGVPANLTKIPDNLTIIGTVNIDETTYQFSPKVLDRANVLEFRVAQRDIADFMQEPRSVNLAQVSGLGTNYASTFLSERQGAWALTDEDSRRLSTELELFFVVLQNVGAEFGYRVAMEISRFVYHFGRLKPGLESFYEALDYQVHQKLLPKLHGSERVLRPLLAGVAVLCLEQRKWETTEDGSEQMSNFQEILDNAQQAVTESLGNPFEAEPETVVLPASYEKCARMHRKLLANGYTSYAEA